MEEIKFAYSVYPKKPIRSLPELGLIRTPKTLLLTKEQVKECLHYATVYRRFTSNSKDIIKVTASSLDRLHNETLISEADYNRLNDSTAICSDNTIEEVKIVEEKINNIVEEVKVEEIDSIVEVKEEEIPTIVDDIELKSSEDETLAKDVVVDAVEEVIKEEETVVEDNTATEEVKEEAVVVEETSNEESNKTKNNYQKTTVNYNKKKH